MGSGWNIGHNLCSNEVFPLHRAKKKKGERMVRKQVRGREEDHTFSVSMEEIKF